jgi:hypothetical protein
LPVPMARHPRSGTAAGGFRRARPGGPSCWLAGRPAGPSSLACSTALFVGGGQGGAPFVPGWAALGWFRGGSSSASRRSFSCSTLGQRMLGVPDLVRMHDVSLRPNCASSTILLLRLEGIQNVVPTNVPVESGLHGSALLLYDSKVVASPSYCRCGARARGAPPPPPSLAAFAAAAAATPPPLPSVPTAPLAVVAVFAVVHCCAFSFLLRGSLLRRQPRRRRRRCLVVLAAVVAAHGGCVVVVDCTSGG